MCYIYIYIYEIYCNVYFLILALSKHKTKNNGRLGHNYGKNEKKKEKNEKNEAKRPKKEQMQLWCEEDSF
jgi:hypothetical protein